MWLTWEVLRCIKVLLHHEWPLKSSSDQTICAFPADCFPMSANPQRLHLNSERTFIHLEALISWSSRGGGGDVCVWTWLCTSTDLSLFNLHTHPWNSQQHGLTLIPTCQPTFSDGKKMKEARLWGDVFGGRHGGKQAAEGEVTGSYTGSLYRFGANRCFLVPLMCWLAALIEQVISVIGWLHIISEVPEVSEVTLRH